MTCRFILRIRHFKNTWNIIIETERFQFVYYILYFQFNKCNHVDFRLKNRFTFFILNELQRDNRAIIRRGIISTVNQYCMNWDSFFFVCEEVWESDRYIVAACLLKCKKVFLTDFRKSLFIHDIKVVRFDNPLF